MKTIRSYIWLSQVSLVAFLLICFAMLPSVLRNNGGASNFGDSFPTIIPYSVGFLLSAAFLAKAASMLSRMVRVKKTAPLMVILATMEMLVLATTFDRKFNQVYYLIHDYLGVALFVYEFGLSIWIVAETRSRLTGLFLAVEATGSLLGLLSLLKLVPLLFAGQIIGAIGFALVLGSGFPALLERLDQGAYR